jgi:hypothetical protein
LADFLLSLASFERNRRFSDNEHLFVLHVLRPSAVELGLNDVLDLCLWLFANVLVLEVKRRRDALRELELEGDFRSASVQEASWDCEDVVFEMQELLIVVDFFNSLNNGNCSIVVALIFIPEAFEFGFFLSLDFDLDMRRLRWLHELNENLAIDNVARFVEWKLCLELHLPLFEIATRVREVKHFILRMMQTND